MSVTQRKPLQYQLQLDDRLCLLHIPKTAGSTLTALIDTNFHVDEIFPGTCIGDYSAEELSAYRLFRGHYDYNVGRFFSKPPLYMTMLREPIERVISLYEFWRRDAARGGHLGDRRERSDDLRKASLGSLEEFVCHSDPWVRLRTSNRQTRQLALGIGGIEYNPSAGIPDDELLDMAKQHLEECVFWGLTERFQDSTFLMAYILGWYPIADYQSLRVSHRRLRKDGVAPEVLARLEEVNQLDLALYRYAEQRFEENYRQMLEELRSHEGAPTEDQCRQLIAQTASAEERIEWVLPSLERHYERRYALHPLEPSVEVLDFNCLQPLRGAGWHRRNGKKNGVVITDTPFRWTGPGTESTLDVLLQKNEDYQLRLCILNAVTPEVLESLVVRVNGKPVALTALEKRSHRAILKGLIKADWLDGDRPFTRLSLEVSETRSLQSIDPNSKDTRLVGLAVHRLQLFPLSKEPHMPPLAFSFPRQDALWIEVVEFLKAHLKPEERVATISEFSEVFPTQFCSLLDPAFLHHPEVQWVVVHKGYYQAIPQASLFEISQRLKPVFANAIFVVYSRRPDLSALSPFASDLLSLKGRMWLRQLDELGLLPKAARNRLISAARFVRRHVQVLKRP